MWKLVHARSSAQVTHKVKRGIQGLAALHCFSYNVTRLNLSQSKQRTGCLYFKFNEYKLLSISSLINLISRQQRTNDKMTIVQYNTKQLLFHYLL